MPEIQPVHVAVGVIRKKSNKILIAKRHKHLHQGDLWEFPGGKLEKGENVKQALARELKEELNLTVEQAKPLISINHQYDDLTVYLDVWEVVEFSGDIKSCEGQPIRWVNSDELKNFDFPAANLPIITAAMLPRYYAILDDDKLEKLQQNFLNFITKGIKLIQLRAKSLSEKEILEFMCFIKPYCEKSDVHLILNSAMANAWELAQSGLHLTGKDLQALSTKPKGIKWIGASCHTLKDLQLAERHQLDFAVLGAVLPTATHPGIENLGWGKFSKMTSQVNIPVYALGGMNLSDQDQAIYSGAQGIAGIRTFLE
jgi:8-oxo-dGTP diphosphatase